MKIAFIGQKGIPTKQGGIEKHVEELSTRLAKAGFDVTVYSRPYYIGNHKLVTKFKKVKIINLPSLKTKHLDAITHTLFSTIHALFKDYDIIHYHGVGPSLLSWLPRVFKPKTKVITTFHCIDRQHQKWGSFAKLILALGEWTACHFSHQTITVSETLKKYCLYRFDKETVHIPNGISISKKENLNGDTLKSFGLKKKGYFIAVSRLVQHKGLHTLINAYNKMETDKKLIIVGAGSSTDNYVKTLKEAAKSNPNIILAGQKSGQELETLFKNAYLFIQPSEAEGLSIALLEAMSYGVPTLISDIEENQEALGGHGLEFKNKNSFDLARQLKFALKHPSAIKKLAESAKSRAEKEYDWKDIVKKTISLYQENLPELGNKKSLILKTVK